MENRVSKNSMIRQILKHSLMIIAAGLMILPPALSQDPLNLETAIAKTLENNYGIIISRSRVEIASLNNNWGNAGRYPSIGFDAGEYNSYDINSVNNFSNHRLGLGLGARWTLFDGFRVNVTKDKLSNLEMLAKGQAAVLVESSLEELILSYYNAVLNTQQLELYKNVMELSRDRLLYEEKKHELGGSASYELLQAKNIFLNDTALYLDQQVKLRNSVRNLNFIMGEEAASVWELTDSLNTIKKEYDFADLHKKMMTGNSNLQNQYTNLLLRQNDISLNKAGYYPSVNLNAGANNNWSTTNRDGIGSSTNNNLNLYGNVSLSYDIYTGGTRKRALQVARINEEIALTQNEEMEQSLGNQLLNLYDNYSVMLALNKVAVENMETASINVELAGEKFRSGAINSFNYRDIQLLYLNAALQNLRSAYNLLATEAGLTRITGGFVNEND